MKNEWIEIHLIELHTFVDYKKRSSTTELVLLKIIITHKVNSFIIIRLVPSQTPSCNTRTHGNSPLELSPLPFSAFLPPPPPNPKPLVAL